MYNNYVMDKKTPLSWFLWTALGLMLLMGLTPVFHLISMQTRQMRSPPPQKKYNAIILMALLS